MGCSLLNSSATSPPPKPAASTFSVAPTSTPTAAGSATATHSASSSSHGSGAKIGIGVGVALAGLLLIAALTWFLLRRRRQRRESEIWSDQNMSGAQGDLGKFYVQRGQIQRKEDLGLGLQSTGMHQDEVEDADEPHPTSPASYRSMRHGPSLPPRSPSRLTGGTEFF